MKNNLKTKEDLLKEQTEEAIHQYINTMVDRIQDKKKEVISFILNTHYNIPMDDMKEIGSRITRVVYEDNPDREYYFLDYNTISEEFIMEWETLFDNTGDIDKPIVPSFNINAPIKVDSLF